MIGGFPTNEKNFFLSFFSFSNPSSSLFQKGKNWNQKEGELLIGPEWLKRWVIVDGEHLLIKENQSSSTIVSSLYLSHLSLSKCWLRPCSLWLIGAQSDPDGRRLRSFFKFFLSPFSLSSSFLVSF